MGSSSRLAVAATVLGLTTACRGASPPFEEFELTTERPPPKGQPATAPPEGALRPWRVWINQEHPAQKKNPAWHAYGPRDRALLDLAPDGNWRCLINPAHVLGKVNERGKISTWIVSRNVRCSSDGWRTNAEGRVEAAFDPDGTERVTLPSAAVYLNDSVNGTPRSTVLVLEGQKVPQRSSDD